MSVLLLPLFFITAMLYSMVGFGGGSTYLALLVLFEVPFDSVRSIALLCNLAVVGFGTWHFARAGHLSVKKVLPFALASIPMAYVGGTVRLDKVAFSALLGVSLAIAALRMLKSPRAEVRTREIVGTKKLWLIGVPIGAILGFLAGLVGIGGGIYLAPVLFFLGWADAKETAAACSFFILVNSIAGLAGQATKGITLESLLLLPLILAVILGGQIGSRLGATTMPKLALQRTTAFLILVVSGRLLWALV